MVYGISRFDSAHNILGTYGVNIAKLHGEDVQGISGSWYEGYVAVEDGFLAVGFLYGLAGGLATGFALILIAVAICYRQMEGGG